MLTHIDISNFTIIKTLSLAIEPGMSVLTGETGAGKSILIDALSLALGDKANTQMIRPEAKQCDITISFDVSNLPAVQQWLSELSLDAEGECIIRRTITSKGRSRGTINAQPVPLAQLKTLGGLLINMHGQHAHHDYSIQILINVY